MKSAQLSEDQKQDRQLLLDDTVNWIGCQGKTETRIERVFLYLIARRVRAAHLYHAKSPTQIDVKDGAKDLAKALRLARNAYFPHPSRLSYLDTNPLYRPRPFRRHDLDVLACLRGEEIEAQKIADRPDLQGRHGRVRVARKFNYPPRPLLAMYLRELYRAWNGRYPDYKGLESACAAIWLFATRKSDARTWRRQIGIANRKLVLAGDPPELALSGDGPETVITHLSAMSDADALAIHFVEMLKRQGITTPTTNDVEDRLTLVREGSLLHVS